MQLHIGASSTRIWPRRCENRDGEGVHRSAARGAGDLEPRFTNSAGARAGQGHGKGRGALAAEPGVFSILGSAIRTVHSPEGTFESGVLLKMMDRLLRERAER